MKKRTIVIIILSAVVLGILGVAIYGYSILNRAKQTKLPSSNEELGITPTSVPEGEKKPDVVNIALFGLDGRKANEQSRSDSIMVVSFDRKDEKVKVASLMRDMYVPIPGKQDNRINVAYELGGAALAVKTINSDFGLDIRDYVTVDFFGFEKVIDKVGGIQIDVSKDEVAALNKCLEELNGLNGDSVRNVKAGLQTLNGRQAVAYSRIRYVGRGDYERTERQRRVINELFKKIKSRGIIKLPGTISELMPYVETSMSNTEILSVAMDVLKFNTNSIEQYRLPVDGTFKNGSVRGMSVLVPDIDANRQALHEFIYKP